MEQANWQRRRDILISLICIGVILWAIWGLVGQFFDAVFLLLISMAIAFLITPAVNALERRKLPRIFATLICYIVAIAVLGGFFYALIYSIITQVTPLTAQIIDFATNLPNTYNSVIQFLVKQGGIPRESINLAITQIQEQATTFATSVANNVPMVISFITNTFLNFVVIIVLSFYLTLDGKRIRDRIFGVIPQRMMSHALLFEDSLNTVVGNYIRGQLILAVFIGVATAIICFMTGIREFALIFGVLGFLFETIPMVGPALASISPILISLLLPDPWPRTLVIIICFVVIQIFESNVLGPRIVGHAVGLHPVASILALLVFAKLFGTMFGPLGGAMGALVATPIIAAIWVVIASIYRSYRGETPEQIMSRKKAPWTIRRPTIPSSLRFRSNSGRLQGDASESLQGQEDEQISPSSESEETEARDHIAVSTQDTQPDSDEQPGREGQRVPNQE